MPSPVISHIRRLPDQTWEIQSNEQHQQGVANLAAEFASHFGMRPWGCYKTRARRNANSKTKSATPRATTPPAKTTTPSQNDTPT
ncbi:MAG: hypothetical protein II375_00805 [Bacteroidales bacterium]|nr:hypothetical protein [Bacteroidales bacterium]